MKSRALILLNLGTPEAPNPPAVARYLREFLMDPYVIDIPRLARWWFVQVMIVPRRARKSAHAYQKIWTSRGSPLLNYHLDLCHAVAAELSDMTIVPAMRYGEPSVKKALAQVHDAESVVIFPLYPQYSWAATESSRQRCLQIAATMGFAGRVQFIDDFYAHPEFVAAWMDVARPIFSQHKFDHVLMSFHGIPERQLHKGPQDKNYRTQCLATAEALAGGLQLNADKWSASFQSRLGRTPWLQPFTDVVLGELVQKGVRRLAVFCPSFVADCLETLEEIGIRGKEQFQSLGGEELVLIPSLNAHPRWVKAVVQMIKEAQ